MNLRTVVRDCLLLRWDLPEAALGPLPPPLRYEAHCSGGERRVPTFALLCFHEGFRLAALPMLRFSYPQFSLALAVTDGQSVPSLWFQRLLVPAWVLPAARFVARRPVSTARLEFDRPSKGLDAEVWRWAVEKEESLEVSARLAAPTNGEGKGGWEAHVEYFRQRRRSYFGSPKGPRCFETEIPAVPAWPVAVEVHDSGLLSACLPLAEEAPWPQPSSALLFPELPLISKLLLEPQVKRAHGVPQPATSRPTSL